MFKYLYIIILPLIHWMLKMKHINFMNLRQNKYLIPVHLFPLRTLFLRLSFKILSHFKIIEHFVILSIILCLWNINYH